MVGRLNQSNRFFTLLAIFAGLVGCKPQESSPRQGQAGTPPVDPMAGFYASSQTEVRAKNNFYYAIFKKDYVRKFADLPAKGEVAPERVPYVGSWFPQKKGGTNVRMRGASPLEKYDTVFNANSPAKAAAWEVKNHTVSATDSAAAWAGHCNGYSAASTRHAEPRTQVTRGSTVFYPEDIKALLAEIHMSAKFYFLGGNRCGLIENASLMPPGGRSDPLTMGSCDDVNPATFHVSVTNWIGIQKYPLIADIHGKEQVWNYPHWKYSVDSREVATVSEAMKIITGTASASNYKFNPAAKSFRSVAMTITHSEAYVDEVITSQLAADKKYKSVVYYYILELNEAGEIIGGEWVGTSQADHPDFVWVALEPMMGDGSPYSGNPNIDPKEVIKLWAESIGADPSKPPLSIMEPTVATEWGRYPKFDVLVNGASTGAAFAFNEPVEISLKVKSGLDGAKPEGLLDGVKVAFDPGSFQAVIGKITPGIHVLEVKWVAGGRVVDEQRARIHVVR